MNSDDAPDPGMVCDQLAATDPELARSAEYAPPYLRP